MLIEVRLPTLPDIGDKVTILFWHVEEGEDVVKGDDLLDISSEGDNITVPAPVSGTVHQIEVEDNDVVRCGEVLCVIEEA